MDRRERLTFRLAIAAMGVALLAGSAHSLLTERRLPGLLVPHSLTQARAAADRGDFTAAAAEYRAALWIDPVDVGTIEEYAGVLRRSGDAVGELGVLLRARQRRPLDAQIHARTGLALSRLGRLDDARASLALAVKLDPGRWEVQTALGDLLRQTGRLREAAQAYRAAMLFRKQDAVLSNKLGIVSALLGQREEAEGWFRKALSIDPSLADAAENLKRLPGPADAGASLATTASGGTSGGARP